MIRSYIPSPFSLLTPPKVVDDELTNYLWLGGPSSNINRLKVVLPILPALVVSLITDAHATNDYTALTKFLATAGVALKSDFLAVSALADCVGYLEYLIVVVLEIEAVIKQVATSPDEVLLDLSFDSSSPAPSADVTSQLIACQDLTLDACSSLLVDSMRMGGASSTASWQTILKKLRPGESTSSAHLLCKLASMAMQRSVRSEEQPWSGQLCEGMSRLCLLIEEKRLLSVQQGRELAGEEIKLLLSILEVMRVGRESMGWYQVMVGGVGATEELKHSRLLLKILQPSLRILLTSLANLTSENGMVGTAVGEIEMTVHAASSGLAFAGSRDVGLLVLAFLRKSILCRKAAGDEVGAGEYSSLVTIVIAEMTQRGEIERLQKETEQEGESGSTQVVEALMFGEAMPPDALSPRQILPSSSTTLGWANYAGLGDTLKVANTDTSSEDALNKMSAYLDAWDECAMREQEEELLDLFDAPHDESKVGDEERELEEQVSLTSRLCNSVCSLDSLAAGLPAAAVRCDAGR